MCSLWAAGWTLETWLVSLTSPSIFVKFLLDGISCVCYVYVMIMVSGSFLVGGWVPPPCQVHSKNLRLHFLCVCVTFAVLSPSVIATADLPNPTPNSCLHENVGV